MIDYIKKHIKQFNPSEDNVIESKEKIYHYTSPQGLLSILRSGKIRFTDCQFLNDKSEYKHIRVPLEKALKQTKDKLYDKDIENIISNYIEDNYEYKTLINNAQETGKLSLEWYTSRYFVFCATDLIDSLNMWNYYVKEGNYQGYNIGFMVSNFLECLAPIKNPKVDVFYGKVIYSEKEKVNVLANIILNSDLQLHQALKQTKDKADWDLYSQEIIGSLLTYLEDYRLFFKESAFSSEKEYRFVIRLPLGYDNSEEDVLNTGYDMRNGIITPFCELSIDKKKTISNITLSPMLEIELAQNGLLRFLIDNGYDNTIKVSQSKIPIRY